VTRVTLLLAVCLVCSTVQADKISAFNEVRLYVDTPSQIAEADGIINFADFAILASAWLSSGIYSGD